MLVSTIRSVAILAAAWLGFMGILFLLVAWLSPTMPSRRSWLARYRLFSWLEEGGLDGVRTQARLQRLGTWRAAFTFAGGALLVAGAVVALIHRA